MKKRFYLLLLLTSSLLIIYFFDNYLSTKVNNLTTVNYVCYLYNNEKCKNEWTSQHHNKDYKDTEQNDITFKEYEFSPSESDYKNDKITVSKQVQREGNLLNKDMFNKHIKTQKAKSINKEDDKIMAGGYAVNSLLLNQGMPAAYTEHVGGKGKHDKVSDRFKHLAVPAGLYLSSKSKPVQSKSMQSKSMQSKPMHSDISVINDDLYEKLLKLAQHDNTNTNKKAIYKKKTTKKKQHKKSMKKKTKKRKY